MYYCKLIQKNNKDRLFTCKHVVHGDVSSERMLCLKEFVSF